MDCKLTLTDDVGSSVLSLGRNDSRVLIDTAASVAMDDRTVLSVNPANGGLEIVAAGRFDVVGSGDGRWLAWKELRFSPSKHCGKQNFGAVHWRERHAYDATKWKTW